MFRQCTDNNILGQYMLFVANFKAYIDKKEVNSWINSFYKNQKNLAKVSDTNVVIAPPFTEINTIADFIEKNSWNLNIFAGAQNLSLYPIGAYTGEITAEMLRGSVTYVIIGHSERRRLFSENENVVNKKIERANLNNLIPIVCISTIEEYKKSANLINDNAVVAYEPVLSIGTGLADNPDHAKSVAAEIKKLNSKIKILYGGSVTHENVGNYLKDGSFNGVLVGKASTNSESFLKIIEYGTEI